MKIHPSVTLVGTSEHDLHPIISVPSSPFDKLQQLASPQQVFDHVHDISFPLKS